jgi:transposase-like protein
MAVASCSAWISVSPSQDLLDRLPPQFARRGLGGVKWVTSDAHEGLKAAITKVLRAPDGAAAGTS